MHRLVLPLRRRTRHSRGQTLVEFALIVPIFILVMMGIFDLGRAVYAFNTINNAAKEAGRVAIVDQTVTDIQAVAVQHAVALGVPASDVHVDFRKISTPNTANSCTTLDLDCLAYVQVTYRYQAATPIVGNLLGQITMHGTTKFSIESVCVEPTDPQCPLGS